jgi:hypothetical protein
VKAGRGKDDAGASSRHPATTRVTEPRLTVVEGAEMVDPTALDEVLDLLVTWAIRAHGARRPKSGDVVSGCEISCCCVGN